MAGPVKKGRGNRRRTKNNRVLGKKDGLTLKQKRFIDFYIQLGNATEAAKRAGYSEKTAYRTGADNIKKPQIRKALDKRLAEIEKNSIAKSDEVMKFLTSSMRGEIMEEVVVVEGEGKGYSSARTVQKQISAHDRLEAAKQLAKRHGLDGDKDLLKLQKEKLKAEVDEMKAAPGDALHINFTFDRRPKDGH